MYAALKEEDTEQKRASPQLTSQEENKETTSQKRDFESQIESENRPKIAEKTYPFAKQKHNIK